MYRDYHTLHCSLFRGFKCAQSRCINRCIGSIKLFTVHGVFLCSEVIYKLMYREYHTVHCTGCVFVYRSDILMDILHPVTVFVYGEHILMDVLVVLSPVHCSGGVFVHRADILIDVLGL